MRKSALLLSLMMASPALAQSPSLTGNVNRDGVHFQVGFGVGAGSEGMGLSHIMEFGATFGGGITIGLLHAFIQNRGLLQRPGGADLIGGWMLEIEAPLFVSEVVLKAAIGLGGEHDQSQGIRVIGGVAWAFGIDFHWPVDPRHGPTLGVLVLQTLAGAEQATPERPARDARLATGIEIFLGWTIY